MGVAHKSAAPLPAKLASLLREAKWLALVALALYLLLIFATFQRGDPGWSHSATDAATRNAGGVVGAWLSDVLLYVFGVSAYWWVALCAYVVAWGYRRIDGSSLIDRRPLWLSFAGFAVLLASSAALEFLRFKSLGAELPNKAGGVIGIV
ncbi:MAG: DNA translocase FtsK 4TM domain-containing protein, partial [Pseudomonadota bacterium]|nr:DNA translocase FtsK 4TM domain-containing protein [Pseudomonadota bacterium]